MSFTDWGKSNKPAPLSNDETDQRAATARLYRLNTEAAHLGSKMKRTANQLKRAQNDQASLMASVRDFKRQIQRIESRIEELKVDRRREYERLDEVKRKIRDTEIAKDSVDNADLKWELNNRILNLKERASILYETILKNKSRVSSLRLDQDDIKTKIFSAKQSMENQVRTIRTLETDASSFQQQLDSIHGEVSQVASNNNSVHGKKRQTIGFASWGFSKNGK